MTTRMAWLDEGLRVLGEHGVNGLRIDRLAARLGLSKGSFYHHFAGMTGYRLDLLAHYERQFTTRYIELVEGEPGLGAREKLARLQAVVISDDAGSPDLEVAVRTWAAADDDARATQERVDATRIDYLRQLCRQILAVGAPGDRDPTDAIAARDLGDTLYLLLVGAQHVVPPMPLSELGRLYDRAVGRALERTAQ